MAMLISLVASGNPLRSLLTGWLEKPAIFGMILAIVASVLENRTRQSQQASLVTLTSPDDFLAESDDEIPLHIEHPVQVEEPVGDGSAA